MAMMKRIRVEILSATGGEGRVKSLQLDPRDVIEVTELNGHQIGKYRALPVIVEWMYYAPSWDKIPPRERTLVMTLKAEGFSVPKPDSLRFLPCLGFFERADDPHPGYGFVYRMPDVNGRPSSKFETLLQLLIPPKTSRTAAAAAATATDHHLSQPLLGDKFSLAYALTAFLYDFHSIGWLHENFHSQNVVFFGTVSGDDDDSQSINPRGSQVLTNPYVLGLHKSRPGGEAWHTDEPGLSKGYLDYQHPDYAVTRRFRYGYDYYSLGLVLLEIGLWTPVMAWSRDRRYRGMEPHRFRDLLVQTYVPRLGPKMGGCYQEIVRVLLSDVLDPNSKSIAVTDEQEHQVFGRFFEQVMNPMIRLSENHL